MKTSVKFDRNSYIFIQENELANAVCKVAAISFRPQCAKCDFASIDRALSPCGCGDLSVRLGSRLSPHRHRVVVEVHWRGAQGWRSISWVVATFNHVGGSFNLSMAATGDVWIIPSFRIWGYVLHVEHISCVIMNCGQLQWAIHDPFSFLNSSLGLAGEKHYQKITIPIFRLVLQNFTIPGYFPYILFYCYLFFLLSSGWFVIAVCGSISVREPVKS